MSSPHVLASTEGAVRVLTLARPEKKNALTAAMYTALVEQLAAASADRAVRVVLLEAQGTAFTSGNDLVDFMSHEAFDENHPVLRYLRALVDFEKPVVAAVNGPAIGIGTTMLLHCDLVYAAASARFQLPFVNLALVPEGGSSLLLPRIAGLQRASEQLLLGEAFDAQAAHRDGLVCEVVPDAELAARVRVRAALLAAKPPEAMRQAKQLLRGPIRAEVHEAMAREATLFAARLSSPETAEAISAFLEKRPPDFSRFG